MATYELIFSDRRHYRVARHVAFWLAWSLFYNLFYQYPIHEFHGYAEWGRHAAGEVQKMGAVLYFLRVLLINSFLGVIVPQILFVYALFYWALPRYFYKKRKTILTLGVIFGLVIIFLFVAAYAKMSYPVYLKLTGQRARWPTLAGISPAMLLNQLVSFPIVVGLALTIKLVKRWWLKHKETEQVARAKTRAELELLKNQVHPHFLFNTLNNIYSYILSGSPNAPEMIKRLSNLLHYILKECDQPLVLLEKEMKMIQDYVSLEKIRYGEAMNLSVELPSDCLNKKIAPLLLIPFIENSFKHGASKMLTPPYVKLRITIEGDTLHFVLHNSKPQVNHAVTVKGNIGLKNVKKRLELLYPSAHKLEIMEETGSFAVYLKIQVVDLYDAPDKPDIIKPEKKYALG